MYLIFKAFAAAGASVSLAGSEGVKICDLCCEASPDQVQQIILIPKLAKHVFFSVSWVEELWPPVLLELLATVCKDWSPRRQGQPEMPPGTLKHQTCGGKMIQNLRFSALKACIPTTSLCCVVKTRACCCSTSRLWWGECLHRTQTPDGALLPTAPSLLSLQDAPPAPGSAAEGRDARRASAITARQSGIPTRPVT